MSVETPPSSSLSPASGGLFGLRGPSSVLLVCLVGTVISASHPTMVNVALPEIGRVFQADLTLVQWVVLAYLLVTSSTVVVSGRLGDMFGARRIYRLGLVGFILGGLVCALAPSLPVLLAARVLQALGGSLYLVAVPTILTEAFPEQQRGRVLGLYSTAAYVGISSGPVLGGLMTELVGWRGVFGVVALLTALTLWLSVRYIPLAPPRGARGRFDLWGSLTYTVMLGSFVFAVSQMGAWGVLSPLTLGLLMMAGAACAIFLAVERRASAPVVDLGLFGTRYLACSTLASVVHFIALTSAVFLMPFYLVQALAMSPALAGLLLAAQPICMVLVGPLVGIMCDRLGSRLPATLGALFVAAALVVLSQLSLDPSMLHLVVGLGLVGVGAAFGSVGNNTAIMGAVPPRRRGMASGTVGTTRYLGQGLGVALASTIFSLAVGSNVGPESLPGFTITFQVMAVAGLASALISVARGARPTGL